MIVKKLRHCDALVALVRTGVDFAEPFGQLGLRGVVAFVAALRVLSVLAAMKVRGLSVYSGHEMPAAGAMERRHRASSAGGNLRAAVFGANDGLLSNASLMLGVAGSVHGAAGDTHMILISGIAGLLAGALSMAAGEYVSVTSQRELYEYQIALEREELNEYPQEEAMELALIYEAKGVAPEDARRMAEQPRHQERLLLHQAQHDVPPLCGRGFRR